MLATEIAKLVEDLVPERTMGMDEGFRWGDPEVEVSGVTVAFMPTVEAIERCAAEGCNLLIAHELLQMPYPWRAGGLEQHLSWRVNRNRIGLLARHGITLYRAHGQLDAFCIHDAFQELLGLSDPAVIDGHVRIFDIEPLRVIELAEQVKARTGMPAVRVTGELQRTVSRVGLPWGGTALSVNAGFLDSVIRHHPDVLIAGESDEYAMRMVLDCDVAMIETGHAVSEEPGLQQFAEHLAERLPEVKVVFHRSEPAWRVV